MKHGEYMIFFSTDKVCLYVLDKGYTVSHYASSQMQWELHPVVVKYSDIVSRTIVAFVSLS